MNTEYRRQEILRAIEYSQNVISKREDHLKKLQDFKSEVQHLSRLGYAHLSHGEENRLHYEAALYDLELSSSLLSASLEYVIEEVADTIFLWKDR